jgi:MFS transporter, DHA2 family, methylenomycin A resistance protein
VPTMTSQSIAAVEPALHGAASAVFNTSRQVGAAIGIATFGPLLGTAHDLRNGFIACVVVGAAATAVALVLTALARPATAESTGRLNVEASHRTPTGGIREPRDDCAQERTADS